MMPPVSARTVGKKVLTFWRQGSSDFSDCSDPPPSGYGPAEFVDGVPRSLLLQENTTDRLCIQ